ncbi:DUF6934 family protein [Dyadobacter fanqingshengii]|uniref:Uncharacterized protein n=1 Tax=Dyadobacter fanqingshengii TaxID=2906443 RepID=A0A9X1TH38_9BACT|nr:hypothetical protein [Dyadobacter fanqingshengii]MCF0041182.1 hypothetical protein [Dyadobacter fanqingshengii]USJ37092.1 hypothetical protein NFI81_04790 [Dyadobacter fanqingshengii]
MNIERYATERVGKTEFRFFSEGKNGRFEMRISFEQISHNFYNLAFGLWNTSLLTIEDSVELRNGDMDKILGTVANVAMSFLKSNRSASIAASGRTLPGEHAVRTRKYQMGLSRNLNELNAVYDVYGFKALKNENDEISGTWPYGWEGEWEKFQVGSNYDAFLINLK